MKTIVSRLVAIALFFSTNAGFAQISPNPSRPLNKKQIEEQHKVAKNQCEALQDVSKKICQAEADGQKSVAEAQAKVSQRDSPKNRLALAEAQVDARYEIAMAKCEDQVDDAKNTCKKNAKAERDKAKAQAKRDSQTRTQTPGTDGKGVPTE